MAIENYFSWYKASTAAFLLPADKAEIIVPPDTSALNFYALYTRPKIFVFTGYPEQWLHTWKTQNFAEIDPIIRYCQIPGTLLLWGDPIVKAGRVAYAAAKAFGIRSGFSCSRIVKKRVAGILLMASGKSFAKLALTPEKPLKLQFLTDLVMKALPRMKDKSLTVMPMPLSQREREVLRWTAEDKLAAKISPILSISERMVKNMQKKFNAPNKTQVASDAVAMGLL